MTSIVIIAFLATELRDGTQAANLMPGQALNMGFKNFKGSNPLIPI